MTSEVDRAAALLDDVLGEPRMLAALLDAYAATGGPLAALPVVRPRVHIVFVGLGSSRYAALDPATALRSNGLPAWVEFASTDAPTPPARDLVLVAISASGTTPEPVAAAERHRGTSLVVAITNQPASQLARAADIVLPLLAGVEASGVSSRTLLATTAVLSLLGNRLLGRADGPAALRPAVEGLESVVGGRDAWLAPGADLLDGAEAVAVIGPASRLGVAEQAALLLREGPRLPASAHEGADWLHTAIYTALPGYRVPLLPGTPDAGRLAGVIAGRGGATVAVERTGAGTAHVGHVLIALPDGAPSQLLSPAVADILAAELWSRASGRDKTP